MLKKARCNIKWTPSSEEEEIRKTRSKETICMTLLTTKKRMDNANEVEVEKCLRVIINDVTLVARERKHSRVTVTSGSKEEEEGGAIKYSTEILKAEGWALLPACLGKSVTKISIGRIPSEIKPEWPIEAVI